LASSEASEDDGEGKGRTTKAAAVEEEAMRPRRRSRAVGRRAAARAMVATKGVAPAAVAVEQEVAAPWWEL